VLNSKTSKHQIGLQGLSRALRTGNKFSRPFQEQWPPWKMRDERATASVYLLSDAIFAYRISFTHTAERLDSDMNKL